MNMKLEIKGFVDMKYSNQTFDKWKIFDAEEKSSKYRLCARDKANDHPKVNAIAIDIYKDPVSKVHAEAYLVEIHYNEFTNRIWSGYVRLSDIKNKS